MRIVLKPYRVSTTANELEVGVVKNGEIFYDNYAGEIFFKDMSGVVRKGFYNTLDNVPKVNPSLLMDFAGSKRLNPLLSFTRASSAFVVNANKTWSKVNSNVPRFNHNMETGESLGLLI